MTGDHLHAVRVSPGCIIPVIVRANPHTMTAQPTLEVDFRDRQATVRANPHTITQPHTDTPVHRSTVVPTPAHQLAKQPTGYLIIGRGGAETSTECLSPITFGSLMILSTTAFLSFICEASPQMIV